MKKSIFLFFAAILCATSAWGADAKFKDQQFLYCIVENTNWNGWGIKYNWYWDSGTHCGEENGTKIIDNHWYAKVPNAYIGKVQFIRCSQDLQDKWDWSAEKTAQSRSNNSQNCAKITGSNWGNATVSWTTYAPPMSSVTLSDNGTSIYGGNGTSSNPYLVTIGSTIKVKASGKKAVEDPDAQIYYNFKQGTSSKQNKTNTTYEFVASTTAGTTYTINLEGYTKVNTTSSTTKTATALYFKTIVPTIKFAGDMTDWKDKAKDFTLNGTTATLDIDLTQGIHEFKIIETYNSNETWLGNKGQMDRKNCTDWVFRNKKEDKPEEDEINCKILVEVEGTYTFSWDITTHKLSVIKTPEFDLSSQPDIIYFQPSEAWKTSNARFAAYFCYGDKNTEEKWANLEDEDEDGVYEVANEKKHSVIIFVRMNPAHPENKWDDGYKWNQSADLYIPMDGNNWFKMTATGENWDNSGEWLYYKKVNVTASASPVEGGLVAGGGTYMYGEDVTLTATANEGYKFVNWTKGGVEVSTDATYTFTATEDAEFVANFKATTITLTTGDNSAVIAANIGETVNVKIERSFTANDGYYTLCVPFNMDPSVIGKAYSLGTITEHVAGEGININLEEETYMLSAGVPYLVLPKANMSELVVENVTIQSDIASGQNVTNEEGTMQIFFEGFYSAPGRITNGTTEYYVGNNGYLYNGEVEIRGLCGLFTITDWEGNPLKVRARVVTREDAATGFENITNGENTTIKLIENGQLIIIRNGEKFNAQGVRF